MPDRAVAAALKRLVAPTLLALAGALPAEARDIFVWASGSDPGDGSFAAPYRTITQASRAAGPGDAILVRPGSYGDLVEISASGTPDRPVTVMPAIAGTVVLDGSATPQDESLVQILGDHVVFQGFHVQNARRAGIMAWGTTGVTIRGNQVSGSERSGIWVGHDALGESAGNLVAGNLVFNNCLANRAHEADSGWPVAIAVAVSDETVVRDNHVFMNHGEGIGVLSSRGVRIENNVSHDNFSVMIYLDNAPGAVVEGNLAATSGDGRYFRRGRPGHGIVIANEHTEFQLESRDILVRHNTLLGVGGVFYGDYEYGGGLHDSEVTENTILDATLELPPWLAGRVGARASGP